MTRRGGGTGARSGDRVGGASGFSSVDESLGGRKAQVASNDPYEGQGGEGRRGGGGLGGGEEDGRGDTRDAG